MRTVVPFPGADSTSMLPSRSSIVFFTMVRPIPMPSVFVEKFGSNDIVVAVDPSDLDDVYAGPREDILAALREDEKDNLLAAPMLEALKMPASFATGVARSYWLLVKESDGFHCTAVGSVSRTKFSKRT